jgi:hypothetical protein
MTPDLRQIIDGVLVLLPDVEWEQLSVTWPGDDDGLWFFWRHRHRSNIVQVESSSGSCPFLIETTWNSDGRWGSTPAETVEKIVALLGDLSVAAR